MYRSLQACRAVAGMLVTLYHLGGAFGADKYFGAKALAAAMELGHHSVVFFFVLSGFILVHAHYDDIGRPQRLRGYAWKRLVRIYPLYLIVLLSVYIIALNVPALANTVPHDPWAMLKTALLLPQDAAVVGGTGAPVLVVAWSMQYEIVFYAVMACFICSRTAGVLVVMLLLINYVACHLGEACRFPRSFAASHFILPFFFGAAIALLVRSKVILNEPLRVALVAISVLALLRGIDMTFSLETLTREGVFVYGIPSAVLIFALVRAEEAGLVHVPRTMQVLGASSYALYLIHFPIVSLMAKLGMALRMNGILSIGFAFVATFLVCVVGAVLLHLYVEKPLTRQWLVRIRPTSQPVLDRARARVQ